ncbi:hypothetical protein VP02_18415 [Pseudomonas ogarae]|uniref:Uncharacterized protein n=1 Tax=Pseudomonas kilonensis TaxID=132476 RepID=A0A0F4XK31_9PSED|nr:hypothetical protein VP02_18415 [Pseudomonas ogarae]
MARELAPAGLRSRPKEGERYFPETPQCPVLGPLRAPAGASSLATKISCALTDPGDTLDEGPAMLSDLAFDLEGSRRHIAQGVQQMIELSQLLANRALDVVDPR